MLNDVEENEMDRTAHNAVDHVRESYRNIETAVRYFGSFDHFGSLMDHPVVCIGAHSD